MISIEYGYKALVIAPSHLRILDDLSRHLTGSLDDIRSSPGALPAGANERLEKLAEALTLNMIELDRIGARVAAAHLDQALNALARQFALPRVASVPE